MSESSPNEIDRISRVFTLTKMPSNVLVSKWTDRMFLKRAVLSLARRLKFWSLGTKLLPHRGQFVYRSGNSERRITFNGRNLQFHALYDECYRHGYELETGLLLTRLCRGSGAFYDIGANWGYFSLLLAASAEFTGPIFAFEPNPRTCADLADVIGQAGLAGRVKPCEFGLGRKSCSMALAETDKFYTGYARLVSTGAGHQITVKCLDELGFPAPQAIKIDAEGMEADILAGGSKVLSDAQPYILFESLLDHKSPVRTFESLELLIALGYRLFVPTLMFSQNGRTVMITYGVDPEKVMSAKAALHIGLFEVNTENRYLLGSQLNILAVPPAKLASLWNEGIINLSGAPGYRPMSAT
jgi:FkbM family methyltransferase